MKIQKAPQEFKLEQLPVGLSKETIDDHYNVIYKGYINKYNEIEESLEQTAKTGNPTFSKYRELKRAQLFTLNAIRLHEIYFRGLGGEGRCSGQILDWIDQDFGNFENWVDDLRAAGMSARGWAVLAYDIDERRLRNITTDIHSDGAWTSITLLALDVYEHAYYFDFATDRKSYIESWLQNTDWDQVNALITHFGLDQMRQAA